MLMVGMQSALISCFLEREIRADRCLRHFVPIPPLCFERVDVEFYVVERRMTRRQVLGFHHRAALWAVIFEDSTPFRIGRVGALILLRIEQRLVNFAWIPVVHQ